MAAVPPRPHSVQHRQVVHGLDDHLERRREDKERALRDAAEVGDLAEVQRLLRVKADPNSTNFGGHTSLMLAAKHGSEAVTLALLDAGANVSHKDSDGWTALVFAALNGNQDVVRLLLKAGADINSRDNYGDTALMMATGKGHEAVVRYLMKAGASRETEKGQSVSSVARRWGHYELADLIDNFDLYIAAAYYVALNLALDPAVETELKSSDDGASFALGVWDDLPVELKIVVAGHAAGLRSLVSEVYVKEALIDVRYDLKFGRETAHYCEVSGGWELTRVTSHFCERYKVVAVAVVDSLSNSMFNPTTLEPSEYNERARRVAMAVYDTLYSEYDLPVIVGADFGVQLSQACVEHVSTRVAELTEFDDEFVVAVREGVESAVRALLT